MMLHQICQEVQLYSHVLRRLVIAVPTLLIIVSLSFLLIRSAPGGPFDAEAALDPQVVENLKRTYDLDKPLYEQYVIYMRNIAQGDLGPSMIYRDFSVSELLATGFPVTFNLGLKSILVAVLVGCSLGVIAAQNHNTAVDYSIMTFAMSGIALPNFVVAPILTLLFGIYLKQIPGIGEYLGLPIAGWGGLQNQILPIIALSLPQIAIISRLMRASMIEVLRSDYILAAKLRGIPNTRILSHHALRAALLPVISYLGPAIAAVVTGSVVIEQIFDLPGIGRYFVQGAINRDYPLVMGIVIFYAAAILILNLIVDILYSLLDPKVRLQ